MYDGCGGGSGAVKVAAALAAFLDFSPSLHL